MQPSDFPPEIDPRFYRAKYPWLRFLSDARILNHFNHKGRARGWQASPAAIRPNLIGLMDGFRPMLEIGPLDRPMVTGDGVAYFDIHDAQALTEKARRAGRDGTPPQIDFVSPNGDLSIVDRTFRAVCSAHCLEHQPNLIGHLNAVARILDDGGYYFLALPDKRYCFDHFRPASTVADALDAHLQRRTVHSVATIVASAGLSTHNQVRRHWDGDHEDPGYRDRRAKRVRGALKKLRAAKGGYIDAHAWCFTPQSFRDLVDLLYAAGQSGLEPVRVYDTPRPRVEFMAILQKRHDPAPHGLAV